MFIIFVLILCMTVPEIEANIDSLSIGEAEYEKGNYQKALSYFDDSLKSQSGNDIALYYRANTLIKLGLRTQALLDYQQAYKCANSQMMRNYCLDAITSLSNNTSISTSTTASPSKKLTTTEQVQLGRSLGTIQLQSAIDKVRIIDTGELVAQDYNMKQRIKLAEMQHETEQNMQQMREAAYYDRYGNKKSVYSALDIQLYQDERHEQEQALMQSIQKSSLSQTQFAQKQAESSQESATNLESQLTGNSLPDGVRLSPLGTNLYVRNYNSIGSTKPLPTLPVELTASEKKLKTK